MANVVVIGAQWGDEGKGKIVDLLCRRADAVVRFQGGPNAGHTVSVDGVQTFLHHIPTGVLHPDRICLLGNGMVIDPGSFLEEVASLEASGVEMRGRLFVSHRAHVILPPHRELDRGLEETGVQRIGTTRKGVGQTYQAKAARTGIRVADLEDETALRPRLESILELYDDHRRRHGDLPEFGIDGLLDDIRRFRAGLAPFVDDTVERLQDLLDAGRRVLFEGSQGTLLDTDHGTYPFVTSASTVAGAACAGAGVGPGQIDHVLGVFKAYATRVGEGPMPTEERGADGERIRERGREYGTTTGRPRRCGWFDAVAGRYAARLNGLRFGTLMLLDVLDEFDELKVAVAYDRGNGTSSVMPATSTDVAAVTPVYETLPGWRSDLRGCTRWEELPDAARQYVLRLEEWIGIRFILVSVGPDRNETIVRDPDAVESLLA